MPHDRSLGPVPPGRHTPARLPALVAGLCDDAAVFPPGNAPLPAAVAAHRDRREQWYAGLVGPLVLPGSALGGLGELLEDGDPLEVSVTLPGGPDGLPAAREAAAALPVRLRALEIPVGAAVDPVAAVDTVADTLEGDGPEVYVEIPRGDHESAVLRRVAERGLRAKFRTGGVRAELHPGEEELAATLSAAVRAGVAFKATAGLHHAVRNTDPRTGFEQHGFLNLLAVTDVLREGGEAADARAVLADRDGPALAARLRGLDPARVAALRAALVSYGTCSITEPLAELVDLGLVTAPEREEPGA